MKLSEVVYLVVDFLFYTRLIFSLVVGLFCWFWPGIQAAYFSNYGDECVDVWAPGQVVTSAIADCDTCYDTWQGTSMASPHICGFIANLLWLDPTLTYHEIKNLLRHDTTTITEYECNTFDCQYPFYQKWPIAHLQKQC